MAEKKGNTLQDDESDIVSISDDGGIIEDTVRKSNELH